MAIRISMIGAGSVGFSVGIARELIKSELLGDSTFVLMDIDEQRLRESYDRISQLVSQSGSAVTVESTLDRRSALEDARFVITSYAPHRIDFWGKDIEIAARHGVELLQGENGGPAGQIHALRNITIMMGIVRDMKELCPDAWIMNFTNPMSMLCTYLYKHAPVRALGFCHQVHGSFGVVAEMLGFEPGDLHVITGGINHMNFLLDIRRKGSDASYMDEFLKAVSQSPYWKELHENIPEQRFTLEFLEAFGIYPVGYDGHICEYMPFFHSPDKWRKLGYRSSLDTIKDLQKPRAKKASSGTIDDLELDRILGKGTFPFPKDPAGEYYKETPTTVMESLLTDKPQYLDAMVVQNNGCISNLAADAVVDVPVVVAGGRARGIDVGDLPFFAAELCRRQIAVHELVVKAAVQGDRRLFLQALCLDPFVHDLDTARGIMADYLEEYREYLPQFFD